ncbi:HAD family hydrolase [Bacillus solitudinis]|uniref:HAD family hydrolase n=1 Tax=Bacillus solitudinis TaxID=2014074 RepID=UPI000C230D6B|nr:HAD family hydrolase [Bacillus solitudinis]
MNIFQDIKIAIFDMDGTLYQDYSFLERYLTYLFEDTLSHLKLQTIIEEAYLILDGTHTIQFGHFVDKEKQITFKYDNDRMSNICSWADNKQETFYEQTSIDIKNDQIFYIGDPWCIAGFYIEKFQIEKKKCIDAFYKVRKEMLLSPYAITMFQPLVEAIKRMPVERRVLMTNTPEISGREFVDYLGIGDLFEDFVFEARKPIGTQEYLVKLLEEGYLPSQILSVGDNPWNDLYPVKQIGGKTCLITKYKHLGFMEADLCVETVEQLANLLKESVSEISSST